MAGRVLPLVDGGAMASVITEDQRETLLRSADEGDRMLSDMAMEESFALMEAPAPRPTQIAAVDAATGGEAATQVVFRIDEPVTVASGQSLSVPVISSVPPDEMIALYQLLVSASHPLAAVELSNDIGLGLTGGVLAIYEPSGVAGGQTLVGDARLGMLPAGDQQLVSFALDQNTLVHCDDSDTETITMATIDRGVMTLTVSQRSTSVYADEAPAGRELDVLIEHGKFYDWDLVEPADGVESTETHFRLPLFVPPRPGRLKPSLL
ncbi:MAG: hypothetical protein CMM46_08690 [Rhodospirillaceae bacterium]|nr:hypothetical protein [Rhodospirillaceae bacterium]